MTFIICVLIIFSLFYPIFLDSQSFPYYPTSATLSPLRSICVSQIPSTGAWPIYWFFFRLFFSQLNTVNTAWLWMIMSNYSLSVGIWSCLGLHRSCGCCCICSEFLGAAMRSYRKTTLPCSQPWLLALIHFLSPPL